MFGQMESMQTIPRTNREVTRTVASWRPRDPALDLLRGLALVRIVTWHLFAQTWLTWIAAVPVMFFIAGTLIDPSRSGYIAFVTKRARRLLVPFWVYGGAVGIFTTVVAVASSTEHPLTLSSLWTWIVPIVDPTSATWTSGWLSSHLWYLRAYLWIILLSPLLVRAARHLIHTISTVAVSVVVLELAASTHVLVIGHGIVRILLGDALVYGCFAAIGIWYRENGPRFSIRTHSILAVALIGSASTFAAVAGLPLGGVNASYPAVFLLGLGTLCALAAIEGPARQLGSTPSIANATRRVSSRALTIYLWHPACIVVASAVIGFGGVFGSLALAGMTLALVTGAVLLVGWVEDIAGGPRREVGCLSGAGRVSPRTGRVRLATTVASLVLAATVPVVRSSWVSAAAVRTVNSGSLVANVPAPSARLALADSAFAAPELVRTPTTAEITIAAPAIVSPVPSTEEQLVFQAPVTAFATIETTVPTPPAMAKSSSRSGRRAQAVTTTRPMIAKATPTTVAARSKPLLATAVLTKTITAPTTTVAPAALPADRLQAAFDLWRRQAQPAITSSIVSVRVGTQTWTARSADAGVDSKYQPTVTFMASSITKTFTAALVMRAVDRGALRLDDPVPALNGLTVPVPAGITPRMLLTHTSGLVDYRNANGYDATSPLTPLDAVALSLKTPLGSAPGTQMTYGNSNYLYLGLLIEQIEGRPYAQLIRELTTSVGLNDTKLDETSRPGWIGFSSGGIVATAADLATWGQALFTPGRVLSDRALALMTTIGDVNLGLGVWPACPCSTDPQGVKHSTAIGHHTADGGMFFFPTNGMTVVAMFEPIGHDTDGRIVSLAAALNNALNSGLNTGLSAGVNSGLPTASVA